MAIVPKTILRRAIACTGCAADLDWTTARKVVRGKSGELQSDGPTFCNVCLALDFLGMICSRAAIDGYDPRSAGDSLGASYARRLRERVLQGLPSAEDVTVETRGWSVRVVVALPGRSSSLFAEVSGPMAGDLDAVAEHICANIKILMGAK